MEDNIFIAAKEFSIRTWVSFETARTWIQFFINHGYAKEDAIKLCYLCMHYMCEPGELLKIIKAWSPYGNSAQETSSS